MAARKDEHHQDHLHKLPRLLPIVVPIQRLGGLRNVVFFIQAELGSRIIRRKTC
nr:MAG TPA: hypothetical protein [Caudoviricetes sp.]